MIETDKYYWHGYLPEYERLVFSEIENLHRPLNIMEIGVGDSKSIQFFNGRFLQADIYGIDVTPENDSWFKSGNITYLRGDQSSRQDLKNLFHQLDRKFDLIIDDGSHRPQDQVNCLIESLPWVKPQSFYILEDVHTSYAELDQKVNAYHLLLTIAHLKVSNLLLTDEIKSSLTENSYFNSSEIEDLFLHIKQVDLFKRNMLPLLCYSCRENKFDYAKLICKRCKIHLISEADSMSFIIKKL